MTIDRWTKDKRRDGLMIVKGVDGYVIMPPAEGLPVDLCPLCNDPFPKTKRGFHKAQLIADAMYPIPDLNG